MIKTNKVGRICELDSCIQEVARDNVKLNESLSDEIQEYLNGTRDLSQLSWQGQYAIQLWETDNTSDIAYHSTNLWNTGRFSFKNMHLFV